MKRLFLIAILAGLRCAGFAAPSAPEYSIQAIRYASAEDDLANFVVGDRHEKIDIAMVIWLIRGGGHNILFDSGYHRNTFLKEFPRPIIFAPMKP